MNSAEDGLDLFEQGRKVGKYTVVKRLSVGGMAEVFLAIAEGPGGFKKVVTLKRIHPEHKEDEDFVAMFLEEARISAGLSHANIAQVFDLGIDDSELFLAMEFVPGEDVSHVRRAASKRGGMPPIGFCAMVARQALMALHYAHTFVDASGAKQPIVHRDVSPKNVMVTYAGSVKVIDFGIAKAASSLTITQSGMVKGSSGYMAPEQMRGDIVDARSDTFSVAVWLHELLVGKRLFSNRTGAAQGQHPAHPGLASTEARELKAPHELVAAVPKALSDVVRRALSFEPEARFASAKEMARAIDAAMGPALFDEEQAAAFMKELFRDNMERTRIALQLATHRGAPNAGDSQKLQLALAALPDEPITGDSVPYPPDADTQITAPINVPSSARADSQPPSASVPPRAPLVLAVDDSAASLHIFRIHMGRQGFEVVGCASPADALQAVTSTPPDIIVLDVVMPEMDGFELCRRIRSLPACQTVPILFLSAACDIDERGKGLDAGGDDFVRKPYEPEELAQRLRSHLARASLLRPAPAAPHVQGAR